ncbi:hypothetical protein BTRA_4989 [Burkholderia thailandensis USAMRU Malaysia |nr:hypothetical protein BTQ_5600 [Burkholderia thailandensis 2002721723]AHI81628.1 hypothetical protein BTJ_4256 [Burkholderia thailandensis E444]AIC89633.1 hypothetical protein BTRA_4989 [Burkholderia thailandensis USAMRU Malaysia \
MPGHAPPGGANPADRRVTSASRPHHGRSDRSGRPFTGAGAHRHLPPFQRPCGDRPPHAPAPGRDLLDDRQWSAAPGF